MPKQLVTIEQISRIVLDCLREGRSVEIDGLCVFDLGESGEFRFEPRNGRRVFLAYVEEDKAQVMEIYEALIGLAARAHRGQVDKLGQPYILHVIRVMLKQVDEIARIVAVLHDIVEDTGITLADLRQEGYSQEVCMAIDCLTRRPDEPYAEMISRVSANPLARKVKLVDLEDNLDPHRLNSGSGADDRRAKYESARAWLITSAGSETEP